jgi:hypothetical protein
VQATKHPNREAEQERPGGLRFGPAQTNAQH